MVRNVAVRTVRARGVDWLDNMRRTKMLRTQYIATLCVVDISPLVRGTPYPAVGRIVNKCGLMMMTITIRALYRLRDRKFRENYSTFKFHWSNTVLITGTYLV